MLGGLLGNITGGNGGIFGGGGCWGRRCRNRQRRRFVAPWRRTLQYPPCRRLGFTTVGAGTGVGGAVAGGTGASGGLGASIGAFATNPVTIAVAARLPARLSSGSLLAAAGEPPTSSSREQRTHSARACRRSSMPLMRRRRPERQHRQMPMRRDRRLGTVSAFQAPGSALQLKAVPKPGSSVSPRRISTTSLAELQQDLRLAECSRSEGGGRERAAC